MLLQLQWRSKKALQAQLASLSPLLSVQNHSLTHFMWNNPPLWQQDATRKTSSKSFILIAIPIYCTALYSLERPDSLHYRPTQHPLKCVPLIAACPPYTCRKPVCKVEIIANQDALQTRLTALSLPAPRSPRAKGPQPVIQHHFVIKCSITEPIRPWMRTHLIVIT